MVRSKDWLMPTAKKAIPIMEIDPVLLSTIIPGAWVPGAKNGMIAIDKLTYQHIDSLITNMHRFLTYESMARHENFSELDPEHQRHITSTWQQLMEVLLNKMEILVNVVNSRDGA